MFGEAIVYRESAEKSQKMLLDIEDNGKAICISNVDL